MPRSIVQLILEDTKDMVADIISALKPRIRETLETTVDESIVQSIDSIFSDVMTPFESLSTEHKRLKALADTGFLRKPEPYAVGDVVEERRSNGRIVKSIIPVTAQFIPLRDTLQSFLSLPGVLEVTLNYVTALENDSSGVLTNFVQGSLWKLKKSIFFKDRIVLPLFIYYDDFEVNNPLGTHRGFQKVGGTYFSIPCLPPEYQSILENIFLALLFHSSDRCTFENPAVFRILIRELNYLQAHGIKVKLPQGEKAVHFALGLFLGDNLSMNQALGFVGSFSANFFCRFCKTPKSETSADFVEKGESLRKVATYNDDFNIGSKETGLKESSVWNDVDYFHVYENFSVDIGHNLFEGVLRYDMAYVVDHIVNKAEKRITLYSLNDRLKTFDYRRHSITNRPLPIREEELKRMDLSMSAYEMLNFTFIFAMLVGDMVSQDAVWEFYLVLRKILDIVLAPSIQSECAVLLNCFVAEHHKMYLDLFNDSLKPKHHHMVHYGRMLMTSGPLCHLNSMRYEAKHRVFKNRAQAITSKVNIIHTIALKEQLQFCYRLVSQEGLVRRVELGPCSLPDEPMMLSSRSDLSSEFKSACVQVPWVDYKGTLYSERTCVVLTADCNDLPIFGQIEQIFCNDGQDICILCDVYETLGFEERLHAYQVTRTETTGFFLLDDLLSPRTAMCVQTTDGNMYVTVKHAL